MNSRHDDRQTPAAPLGLGARVAVSYFGTFALTSNTATCLFDDQSMFKKVAAPIEPYMCTLHTAPSSLFAD